MSHIEGNIDDATTDHMIATALARGVAPDADAIALALIEARFKSFEIATRLDAVLAGLRKVRRVVEVAVAMS